MSSFKEKVTGPDPVRATEFVRELARSHRLAAPRGSWVAIFDGVDVLPIPGRDCRDEGGADMVVTMLEARVAPEKEADLIRAYEELGELPPFIVEAFLLHATDSDVWRMVNVVRSREELEGMRASMLASGEAPGGVRVFRVVGAEPTLTIFDVVAHPPIRPATTS